MREIGGLLRPHRQRLAQDLPLEKEVAAAGAPPEPVRSPPLPPLRRSARLLCRSGRGSRAVRRPCTLGWTGMNEKKPATLIVGGIMSGTSADGIDMALVRIAPGRASLRLELLAHRGYPYPKPLRQAVLA